MKPEDARGLDSAMVGPHASWATKSAVALTSIVLCAKRALSYAYANISKIEALCYKRRPGAMRSAACS